MFSEISVKGLAIMYRCVPRKNKQESGKTDADLLGTCDALKKPDETSSENANSLSVSRKIRTIFHSGSGSKFDPNSPLLLENGSIVYHNHENKDTFSRILKLGRSNPRRATVTFDENNCADICGVALGDGCVCTKPPVEGRKRCVDHKGMKINGLKPKLFAEHESSPLPLCGFILENGHVCIAQVVPGRKRCEEHKGKKVKQLERSGILLGKASGMVQTCGANLEDGTFCTSKPVEGRKRCLLHKGMRVYSEGHPSTSTSKCDDTIGTSDICGAGLGDGSICRRAPVLGRKRCEQHKGTRAALK